MNLKFRHHQRNQELENETKKQKSKFGQGFMSLFKKKKKDEDQKKD